MLANVVRDKFKDLSDEQEQLGNEQEYEKDLKSVPVVHLNLHHP